MIRVATATELKTEIIQFIDDKIEDYHSFLRIEKSKPNSNFRLCYEIEIKITELINVKHFIMNGFIINDCCIDDVKDLITKLNMFIDHTEFVEGK